MNNKEHAMRAEAKERIIECLRDGYSGYYGDLHGEIFNTGYYIIGTSGAKRVLEEYGVFDAIEKVVEYEKENFGEVHSEIHNPEKLVNVLFYIIGEEILFEMMDDIDELGDNWDNLATDETNAAILAQIN